jgi:catechol 2,3-dioxygenase-like lactoylglutathione lyase family enzyme
MAVSTAADIIGIRQVALTVLDVGRSTEFYRDALGLPFLFAAGPALAFFDLGGVRLMLTAQGGEFEPRLSFVLFFRVADIEAAFAALTASGGSSPRAYLVCSPAGDLRR